MKTPLSELLVSPSFTILETLNCIDRNAKGIALVVENDLRLLGTVTDGDIRRAILSGSPLDSRISEHMQRNFIPVGLAAGRAEVLDLMRARSIEHIPIVDLKGKLVGLHVMREIIGAVTRSNWAVIMAGGRGERLRPLTEKVPKPMLRVAGRPILERILLHLVGYGIREIFISVNYMCEIIEGHFRDGSAFGCNIRYLHEDKPLGTAGALSLLPEIPLNPVLVMNGDLITQADIDAMLKIHSCEANAITVGVREFSQQVPFGCIELRNGMVHSIVEKPVISKIINAGIYVLSPDVFRIIPKKTNYLMTTLLEESLNLGHRVGVYPVEEEWVDVGRHEELLKARGIS
jgi:dTDP-glucose pyrophosphorylase/predicted transcriptional regulator